MPYTLNPDGSLTITGADPTGTTDSTAAIQNALNYMYSTYGGGRIYFPQPGTYFTQTGITLQGGNMLVGNGVGNTYLRSHTFDTNVVSLDTTCYYAGVRDVFMSGWQNTLATKSVVKVASNVPAIFRDCVMWGGSNGLATAGIDGLYENCLISGWSNACVLSNGANWYVRCKLDMANVGGSLPYSFYQGTATLTEVMENHFVQCDLSGNFTDSVYINDGTGGSSPTAISVFEGCVFSSPINIQSAFSTLFSGCEMGSPSFTLATAGGSCSVVGSVGVNASVSLPGSVVQAGNINIT